MSALTKNLLSSINPKFILQVSEFKEQLKSLDASIPRDAIAELGDANHQKVEAAFASSQQFCREMEQSLGNDRDRITTIQQYFRAETDPWFSQSWIANRARTKPSGFAGDFEMLVKLYDRRTPATGLGSYLDLCISELPLACAVRARMVSARDFLLKEIASRRGDVRILDVASGPCREFLEWPEQNNSVEVICLDNDQRAIEYVNSSVVPQLPKSTSLTVHRYNALRTRSAKKTVENFGSFDIMYSVGLCDYLTDEQLVRLFAGWRDSLNDDGVMLIAFKDTVQYDQTPYQWHLDWFFYQRTQQDVLKLYEQAGIDVTKMEMSRDETEIIINFVNRIDNSHISRLDNAIDSVAQPKQPNVRASSSSKLQQ